MSTQPQRSHEELTPEKAGGQTQDKPGVGLATPESSTPASATFPITSHDTREARPLERETVGPHRRARGTAAMDPDTRKEVARKGGIAVSKNRQHMADIGRKGGQSISRNREHMAKIGRKGGAASRGHKA
ncbi:hypothetical protein WDW86_12370 [Bdellovibrionota bacterium FG-2]